MRRQSKDSDDSKEMEDLNFLIKPQQTLNEHVLNPEAANPEIAHRKSKFSNKTRFLQEEAQLSDDSQERNGSEEERVSSDFQNSVKKKSSKHSEKYKWKESKKSSFKPEEAGSYKHRQTEENPQEKRMKQTAEKMVITADNYQYNIPFSFTIAEIQEAFNTLDIHQTDYITADEVRFFLDILGEQATEAEIGEMINMLDIQGTGKVFFEEF